METFKRIAASIIAFIVVILSGSIIILAGFIVSSCGSGGGGGQEIGQQPHGTIASYRDTIGGKLYIIVGQKDWKPNDPAQAGKFINYTVYLLELKIDPIGGLSYVIKDPTLRALITPTSHPLVFEAYYELRSS